MRKIDEKGRLTLPAHYLRQKEIYTLFLEQNPDMLPEDARPIGYPNDFLSVPRLLLAIRKKIIQEALDDTYKIGSSEYRVLCDGLAEFEPDKSNRIQLPEEIHSNYSPFGNKKELVIGRLLHTPYEPTNEPAFIIYSAEVGHFRQINSRLQAMISNVYRKWADKNLGN